MTARAGVCIEGLVERVGQATDHFWRHHVSLRRYILEHVTERCHGVVTLCHFARQNARFQGLRSRIRKFESYRACRVSLEVPISEVS